MPVVTPKFQAHEIILKLLGVVDDWSVNGVDNPLQTLSQLKSAVGLQFTIAIDVSESEQLFVSLISSVTV